MRRQHGLLQTYPKKRVLAHAADAVVVKFLNHVLQLLLLQAVLAQLPGDAPQVLQVDVLLVVDVEQVKGPLDLLARVAVVDLLRGHARERLLRDEELGGVVLRLLAPRRVQPLRRGLGHPVGLDDLQRFLFGDLEAQRAQCDSELVVVEVAVFVDVEERELGCAKSELAKARFFLLPLYLISSRRTASLISAFCSSLSSWRMFESFSGYGL